MALALLQANMNTVTGIADEAITAGDFVKTTASTDVVTSDGVSSWAGTELTVAMANASGDENLCIGIAANTATTGGLVTVYTQGVFIVKALGAIASGNLVQKDDGTDQTGIAALAAINNNSEEQECIGRALTGTSGTGKYCVILLNVA